MARTTAELEASDDPVDKAVLRERRRIAKILKAHESWLADVAVRLQNCINSGLDLEEEMKLPPDERVQGFHWPDS